MKKKAPKKLSLKRETLRTLRDSQLRQVAGGENTPDNDRWRFGELEYDPTIVMCDEQRKTVTFGH